MKKILILPVLALVVFISTPGTSHALSCINPEGMVDYIVSNPDTMVVTAKAAKQTEYVKERPTADTEGMYDAGYSAQFLEISKAHQGGSPKSEWVYFTRNSTWNYLCAGAPPKIGSENIYVINRDSGLFSLPTVSAVYPTDSDIAKKLLAAIEKNAGKEGVMEPALYEVSNTDMVQQIYEELKDMALIVKIKLEEWKFWTAKTK